MLAWPDPPSIDSGQRSRHRCGLAGDQARFKETFAFVDSLPEKNTVAALGFYGERLKIGYGSLGGWDSFGLDRLVARSKGNILFELDDKPALDLYKNIWANRHKVCLPPDCCFLLCKHLQMCKFTLL